MKKEKWIVSIDQISKHNNTTCTYCISLLGEEHKNNCVQRKRSVVIQMKVDLVVEVPEDWDEEMINFHRNDSSWCADNVISELEEKGNIFGCMCDIVEFEYKREATENEHIENKLFELKKED